MTFLRLFLWPIYRKIAWLLLRYIKRELAKDKDPSRTERFLKELIDALQDVIHPERHHSSTGMKALEAWADGKETPAVATFRYKATK